MPRQVEAWPTCREAGPGLGSNTGPAEPAVPVPGWETQEECCCAEDGSHFVFGGASVTHPKWR